jgi:serine/threonine protein kinase
VNSPQAFGPYELTERINIGGMAEVFRAQDRAHSRLVAIKRILPSIAEDDEFIQMFRDEAAIASQLDHPNIAKIFDVGKVDLSYYLALEFVNGKDLRVLFDRAARAKQPLPLDFVLYVIGRAADALDYAHHRQDAKGKPLGVVHRDVSPQNILVSFDGDVKIIDFGIAKAAGKLARTQVGTIKGKFGYMSPEQVRGLPIDQRSDVFSLGICLWELLTLERLFSGDNEIVIMEKIRACDIPSLTERASHVPAELEAIILKALAKDVDERYPTATQLYSELNAFARAKGLTPSRDGAAEFMRRTFAGDPAIGASIEEKSFMAEQKSGSDLDVFEGLSKKSAPADETPTPFAPGAGAPKPLPPTPRHKTLLGMPSPAGFPTGPGKGAFPTPPPAGGSPSKLPAPPAGGRSSVPPPPGSMRGRPNFPSSPPMSPPGGPRAAGAPGPAPLVGVGASRPPGSGPPPLPGAVAAQPPAPGTPAVEVEMDWDEDEKTSVFEKNEATTVFNRPEGLAPAPAPAKPLPAAGIMPPTSGRTLPGPGASHLPLPPATPAPFSAPAPALGSKLPPVSRPGGAPGLAPPPSRALAQTTISAPPRERTSVTSVISSPRKTSRNKYMIAGVGAIAVAAVVFFAMPKSGKVSVFVSAAKPVNKLAIYVDGIQKCTASPCNLELEASSKGSVHAIKVAADGYAAQEQGVTVQSGAESAVNFKLEKAAGGTGIKVAGKQDGVELFIDGKEIGPLPQEAKDIAPGNHKVLFKGSDRYAPDERTVTLEADEMKDLGTVSLKVLRGLATFDVRTSGAKVTLVSGKDRRQLSDFSQPVEIETSKNWTVEATKTGHEDFKQAITFEDRAEKTFVISLAEKSKPEPTAVAAAAPRSAPEPRAAPEPKPAPEPAAEEPEEKKPASSGGGGGGNCTLNINSIPVSNVVLDGKPLGGTPKIGVSASAGSHTVIFINPEEGRKVTSVTCKSGDTKTVAVRFSQ